MRKSAGNNLTGNIFFILLNPTAPYIDFVQVDFNSTAEWGGETFCADKEIYVADADGNNKYVIMTIKSLFHHINFKI